MQAIFFLRFQVLGVYEPFVEFRDPAQPCFQRGGLVVDVVSIKAVALFQPQRVARAQAHGLDTELGPGGKNGLPHRFGVFVPDINLKTARPGVARGRDDDVVDARHRADFKGVVVHRGQIFVRQFLQRRSGFGALHS